MPRPASLLSRAAPAPLGRSVGRLAVAFAVAAAYAQAAQAQSLKELYDAARSYDATYLSARAAADSAQYRADQSYALQRPSVGLGASATRSNSSAPYSSTPSTHVTSEQVGINAQQTLYNRANSLSIDQADRGVDLARAQLAAAEQDLIVRVAQAYFDVLGARDTLDTVQAAKKAIAEQLASAKRNFEVGTATITDTREAQARYDLAVAQELAADNDVLVKQTALDQLVGRSGLKPLPLAAPVALPPVLPAEVDNWVATADASNQSVHQARLALDVAQLETGKARAGHLPTLTLNGSVASTHSSVDGNAVFGTTTFPISASGTGPSSSIGVALNLPLFAGFAVQNRVKETLSLEDKARSDLEAARRGVAQGTRQAFFGVQSGVAQVKALEAAEASSKLALEATQTGYKVGVRVNIDVLNAQTQLYQTQRDLAKARYDVIVGGLRLRQTSGVLKPEDVDAVNALLAR